VVSEVDVAESRRLAALLRRAQALPKPRLVIAHGPRCLCELCADRYNSREACGLEPKREE